MMDSNEEKGVVDMNGTPTTTNKDTQHQPALCMVNLHNNEDKTTRDETCDGLANPAYIKEDETDNVTTNDKSHGSTSQGNEKDMGCVGLEWDPAARQQNINLWGTRLAILKNLTVISLAFVCLFTSYNAVANLQSSLHRGVGTIALCALYTGMVISCCLIPTWAVRTVGEKATLCISSACYCSYMAAQLYPRIYTLVPTSLILGLGAAPLWAAKSTYLTKIAIKYAEVTGQSTEVVITRFFGIFFLFFQTTNIWGNLISSSVLSIGVGEVNDGANETDANYPHLGRLETCGYHFCIAQPNLTTSSSSSSSGDEGVVLTELTWRHYTIFTVFLVSAISSTIVMLFVDPVTRFVKTDSGVQEKSVAEVMLATFSHMRHPYQLLILPFTIWSGLEQQFLSSDFTAAYVSCSVGVHMLGYVLIAYGVSDSLGCLVITALMKKMGRVPGFVVAFVLNVILIVVFVYWKPRPEHLPWLFVTASLWGLADSVWQTQINALYSVIFPADSAPAAFSNYRLWESVGLLAAYITSSILCVDDKISILLGFLLLGMVGYVLVEVMERRGGPPKDSQGRVIPVEKLIISCFS